MGKAMTVMMMRCGLWMMRDWKRYCERIQIDVESLLHTRTTHRLACALSDELTISRMILRSLPATPVPFVLLLLPQLTSSWQSST